MYRSGFSGSKTAVALVLCLPALATAGDITGRAVYRIGQGLNDTNRDRTVLNDRIVTLGWRSAGGLGWNFATQARYRRESRLQPGVHDEFRLRKFTVRREAPSWAISAGKQELLWGKSDGIPLLDLINPAETREFVLDEPGRARIPVWMGTGSYYAGRQDIQLVVVPDIETNRLPERGARFDPVESRLPPGVDVELRAVQTPAETADNTEYGLRWTGRAGPWELTALGYRGWSNAPVFFTEATGPSSLRITPRPVRQTLYGVAGEAPYGSTVLRFEALYTADGYATAQNRGGLPEQHKRPALHAAIGVDWMPGKWLVSGQLFRFEDSGQPADFALPRGYYGSFLLERQWLQQRLDLRFFAMAGLERDDGMMQIELNYQFRRRFEVSIGGDFLYGDPDEFFGRYDSGDRVTTGLTVHF